jgi:ammonia channel protein AmtB
MGVIDYSGGYVIHLSSGTAGFAGAYWIGPRLKHDRENFQPNNVCLMMVGAGILWIGWNGFNGGVSLQLVSMWQELTEILRIHIRLLQMLALQ